MKKFLFKTASLLSVVCLFMTGCGRTITNDSKNEQNNGFGTGPLSGNDIENVSGDSIEATSIDTSVPKPFNFSMAINVCNTNESGGIGEPIEMKISIENKQKINLNIIVSVSPDSSMNADTVPIKFFVIADGKMIPFSINGNSVYSTQGEVEIPSYKEAVVPISFEGKTDMYLVSIVACSFPEFFPKLGNGLFSGICTYTFINISNPDKNLKYKVTDLENYVEVNASNENIGIGIDIKPLEEEQNAKSTQYKEDFILSKAKDDLWVKFNEDSLGEDGLPLNVYYSLLVLCDGKPIQMFGDEYTHIVNTPALNAGVSSRSAFQYAIPKELIPDDRLHIFQCIAVPCYVQDAENQITSSGVYGLSGTSSQKIRVLIKE